MNAQQLKNSILQEAIEGRLVPQDPNDEPASVLLDKIRKEKARLVKEGKLKKKDLEETPISEDEIPFEIPKSWVWVKIGTIFNHSSGKQLSGSNTEGVLREYITTSNLYWGRFELNNLKSMYYKDSELEKCTAKQGDLLVCEGGDIGRSAIWPYDYEICLQNHVHRLRPYDNRYTKFVFYIMWYYKSIGLIGGKGIGIQGLSASALKQITIPLPPLAEQKRIVANIEELLPMVEAYGKAQESLDKLNEDLPERLKKSILQEAIEGRLVPQDPNDEPASVLLDKICKEKAKLVKEGKLKKKDLIETPIEEDEKPFEIPENWVWVRFGDIFNVRSAKRIHQTDWQHSGVPFFRGRELVQLIKTGEVNSEIFIKEELYETLKRYGIPSKDDILISAVGTIGRVYIVKGTKAFYYKDAYILCCENIGKINPQYIALALTSPYLQKLIHQDSMATTVAQLTIERAKSLVIPFPPLAEQKRIVAKIEELMKEIDKLKK